MPKNRSLPILLALMACLPASGMQDPAGLPAMPGQASPAPSPSRPPSGPEMVLDEAIKSLRAVESAAADVKLDAQMLGQSFRVTGQYLKAPEYRSLLRLSIESLGDVNGVIQQVSDGTTLWDYSQVLDGRSLRKIQLKPVLELLDGPEVDPDLRQQWMTQLGFGGPEALLSGLRRSVAFGTMREETLDGKSMLVFGGLWEDQAALGLPGAQPGGGPGGFIPAYVPKIVELWLGKDDHWPYKLVMQGEASSILRKSMIDSTGRPIGRMMAGQKELPTKITLIYEKKAQEVKMTDFLFQAPPGVEILDDTDQLLTGLQAQVADAAARKRSEQAQQSGDLLDAPLTAPRPDPGSAPSTKSASPPGAAPSPETFRSSAPPRP